MTRRTSPRPPGWVARAVAGLAVAVPLVAGCSAAHPSLSLGSGAVSDCFRALPTAKAAVHENAARLVGVQRVPADVIEKRTTATTVAGDADTEVCAFAFQGAFAAGQVTEAPPTETGTYAVVLVTSRHLVLIRSFVATKLPSHFRHRVAVGAP
jgi:hypothetical protein